MHLFIFEITQNYIIVFFKVIRRKQTSKISQSFTWKHKINESNAGVAAHYWIVCLYSKNVSYMNLFSVNYLISSGTCSTLKLRKQTISLLLQNKAIECVPASAYSLRFMTYPPSFIVFWQVVSRTNTTIVSKIKTSLCWFW